MGHSYCLLHFQHFFHFMREHSLHNKLFASHFCAASFLVCPLHCFLMWNLVSQLLHVKNPAASSSWHHPHRSGPGFFSTSPARVRSSQAVRATAAWLVKNPNWRTLVFRPSLLSARSPNARTETVLTQSSTFKLNFQICYCSQKLGIFLGNSCFVYLNKVSSNVSSNSQFFVQSTT